MKILKKEFSKEELSAVEELKTQYGNLFEVKATGRDKKEYIGYFRPLTLDDYDLFISGLRKGDNSTEIDLLHNIATLTFVAGDDEMLDLENRFDVVNAYIKQMYSLLDPKYCISTEDGLFTTIKLYDLDISNYKILEYKIKDDLANNIATFKKGDTEMQVPVYLAKFKYPSYSDYKRYLMAYDSGNVVSAGLELAKMCYVEGSKEILNKKNPSFVYSGTKYFSNIIKTYDAELKKK